MATEPNGNPSVDNGSVDSAANGVKEAPSAPSDPSKKLRILCLHGFRTSGNILAQQVQLANWARLISDITELVFLDAPWPAQGKSDVEKKFDGPYYEWYQSNADYTEVSGLDGATSHISDYLSLHGPFDGLLGFSQGAILVAALVGLSEKGLGPKMPNINFTVVVGGGQGRAKPFHAAYEGTINCPSIHFLGEKDFMRPYGEALVQVFKDPVVVRHSFAHVVPRLSASEGQMFRDFLLKQQQAKIAS